MRPLWTVLVLVAAAINPAPAWGAFAPERMAALYDVDLGAGAAVVHAFWLRTTAA